jgi:hypothetical protein
MSLRLRRWIAALLLLVFATGTTQAASALPRCAGPAHDHVQAAATHAGHGDHQLQQAAPSAKSDDAAATDDCTGKLGGMSVKTCAALCLMAVPVPALARLDAPSPATLPDPLLDMSGRDWSPPGDNRPPRTSSIG